jgi:type IV/VI secretion system ImpK/VasF family protein
MGNSDPSALASAMHPRLSRFCEPYLLYISNLRHRGIRDIKLVRRELMKLLERQRAIADQRLIRPSYNRAEKLLVYTTDAVVLRLMTGRTHEWTELERELYESSDGGNKFYDHFNTPEYNDPELREIAFLCMCLGFEGRLSGQQNNLEAARLGFFQHLPPDWKGDVDVFTPQAAKNVRESEMVEMPYVRWIRWAVIVLLLLAGASLIGTVVYSQAVKNVVDNANAVTAQDHP